jgi:hypothetical protein
VQEKAHHPQMTPNITPAKEKEKQKRERKKWDY